ncbi:AEC family transporter [Prolixibacteraceae bacterium Z1-6]|uniref:AEC family transporter n=1 Tax=Draconibacterium aestuarii TaxID=2998507 RepID=A0A9X3F8T0_9BACT|nr:AEC family transporter [Prolixibacteraceae bacterium Z1-6]
MGTFLIAVKTVLPLFLVIGIGTLFSRTKASNANWIEVLNKYALYIGFPALVIASLMHLEVGEQSYSKLILFTSGYIVFCILLAFPVAKAFRFSSKMRRTLFLILPFGNIAYLGLPVLQNTFGDEILPVAAIVSALYIFWLLTLAMILVEVYGDDKLHPRKLVVSLAQNPLLISVIVGLAIVFFNIKLPEVAQQTIQLFSDSVTPVVLFALGMFLGMQKIGKLREWLGVFAFVVVTMLVLPFVFYQFLKGANFDTQLLKASVIDAAMPMGLTPYALSLQYKLETTLAARIVVLGTLLSIFIIPLWMVWLG